MKELKDKVVIITGAGSGMGKAMALRFAEEKAKLVLIDFNETALADIVKTIHDKGEAVIGMTGDVSKEEDIRNLFDKAVHEFGGVDILVNNAGVMDDFKPVADASNELWKRVMGINIDGPFYTCRLAVPLMLKRGGGKILNIASIGGLQGARAGVAYTSSKHALIGLTKNIAFHYGDKAIRCNAIAPGGVNTNIGQGMNPDPLGFAKINLGINSNIRMGEPDEIAQIALFLVSDRSSLINGAIVVADAGWTAY